MTALFTTATISAITTLGSFPLVGILVLLCLTFLKELATQSDQPKLKALGKAVSIAMVPLVIVFILVLLNQVFTTIAP